MCPGQYPSPTPSRECTPMESIETSSEPDAVSNVTPDRPLSRDYTASDFTRQRPQFAGSQSVPNIPLEHEHDVSPPYLFPYSRRYAPNGRRVSDPFQTTLRKQRDSNAVRKQNGTRRAISAQTVPTFVHDITASHIPSANHSRESDSAPAIPSSQSVSGTSSSPPARSPPSSPATSSSRPSTPPSPSSASATPSSSDPRPEFLTSLRAINDSIHVKLREDLTPKDGKGVIYILRDPSHPKRGYKIGITQHDNHTDRIKQYWWRSGCGFVPDVVWVTDEITYCKRTEDLIHLDLRDRQRTLPCEGHKGRTASPRPRITRHREWFDITEEEAKQTVKKWERFMREQSPYDMWRQLSPIWRYLLAERRTAQVFTRSDANHCARREQWTQLLASPTPLDVLRYKMEIISLYWRTVMSSAFHVWSCCAEFFWQTLTLISWFITLMILQNTFAATAFAIVMVCAWFSIMPQRLSEKARSKS